MHHPAYPFACGHELPCRAMLEWLENKVAALEAEEDGSLLLSFDEAAYLPVRKLAPDRVETCFPTFPRRNLFSLFLNFRTCLWPADAARLQTAPFFSLRQISALRKMLASRECQSNLTSRAAFTQPKTFRVGRGLEGTGALAQKARLLAKEHFLSHNSRMRISTSSVFLSQTVLTDTLAASGAVHRPPLPVWPQMRYEPRAPTGGIEDKDVAGTRSNAATHAVPGLGLRIGHTRGMIMLTIGLNQPGAVRPFGRGASARR